MQTRHVEVRKYSGIIQPSEGAIKLGQGPSSTWLCVRLCWHVKKWVWLLKRSIIKKLITFDVIGWKKYGGWEGRQSWIKVAANRPISTSLLSHMCSFFFVILLVSPPRLILLSLPSPSQEAGSPDPVWKLATCIPRRSNSLWESRALLQRDAEPERKKPGGETEGWKRLRSDVRQLGPSSVLAHLLV